MKSTTPIHKIKTEFSLPEATSVGGSQVFLAYLEKIKLAEALKSLFCGKAGNALFPVHRILLYLLVSWTLCCERLFQFRRLQHDSLLRLFLGGRLPHHSLLYKELARLGKSGPNVRLKLRNIKTGSLRASPSGTKLPLGSVPSV